MLGPEILAALQAKANRSAPGQSERFDDRTDRESAAPPRRRPAEATEAEAEVGRRRRPKRRRRGRDGLRGAAAPGAPRTRGAPRRPGARHRDRAGPPRGQAPDLDRAGGRDEKAWPQDGSGPEGADVVGAGQCVVVGLGLLLYFTPIMSARNIVVTGLGAVTQDEVVAAAAVEPGTPLLQVDTDAVAERVAAIRRIASARVQREYPSTLRVTVVERVPVVVKDFPDGPHVFDQRRSGFRDRTAAAGRAVPRCRKPRARTTRRPRRRCR